MSLELDIIDYIALNAASLVVDTNLFPGDEPDDSPDECVTVVGSSGYDNESGIEVRPFQIIVKNTSYVPTQTLAYDIFDMFKNKPGFPSTIEGVFYCEVINSPFPLDRDARGRRVFSMNFLLRMLTPEYES